MTIPLRTLWTLFITIIALASHGRRMFVLTPWHRCCINMISSPGAVRSYSQTAASGTTTFALEGNRMFAALGFVRPDGTIHRSFAFVDTGSPSTILSLSLFKELNLDQKKRLAFRMGEMTINVDSSAVESASWLPFSIGGNRTVEAVLPASVLQKFQVVIDYSQLTLTLTQPGTLTPQGSAVPFVVDHKTGLIVVDAVIGGKSYSVTIDNGSSYTWLRKTVAQEWLHLHPDWQRGIGAVGASNMRMADDGIEAAGVLMRIPEIKLGSLRVHNIGALAIGPGKMNWDFIDWYSKKNPVPVIGWLGGNVLRGFRITLDYPNHVSYWLPQTALDPRDLDQVGLTLTFRQGGYFVAAIATQNGKPTVQGIRVGDKLLQVDRLKITTAPRAAILSALHGEPGQVRALIVERDGRRFEVKATITAF